MPVLHQGKMRRKRVCSKESKGVRKWHQARRHSWASSQRPGCQWPLDGRLHRTKIISHACWGNWGHRLCWLVGTRVGGRWSLHRALMSVWCHFVWFWGDAAGSFHLPGPGAETLLRSRWLVWLKPFLWSTLRLCSWLFDADRIRAQRLRER